MVLTAAVVLSLDRNVITLFILLKGREQIKNKCSYTIRLFLRSEGGAT